MTLGFVGTGHITVAMVEGLCAAPAPGERIVVSPRNAENAADLARRFANVMVASDNQAVVDASDVVFLAVRPPVASEVVGGLRFRSEQAVISLVALHPREEMRSLTQPAATLVRAVPLPSAARCLGPIAYFPHNEAVETLLARVGTPVAAPDEAAFHRLWSLTGLISPFAALIEEWQGWAEAGGVGRAASEQYVRAFVHCLADMAQDLPPAELARRAATPGGINEQALCILRETDGLAPFRQALDSVFARMNAPKPR
jgi:pyrroline-5-carboxylate reductase